MDKCLYNGRMINSFDVAASFEYEKTIRECKELRCCDPDCNSLVRYKHGAVRIPYFAHISADAKCDYDKYSGKKSELFKSVQKMVYEHFKEKYSDSVDIDVKLIKSPAHYTSLVFSGKKIKFAVDITDKTATSNTMDNRKETYRSLGY